MRYFKYPYTNEKENEAYKAELAAFEEQQKKLVRKEKLFGILAMVVMFAAGFAAFALLSSLISYICFPKISILILNALLAIFEAVLKLMLILSSIVLACIAGLVASSPIWKIQEKTAKETAKARRAHARELAEKDCENIKEYYGFQTPNIVTKCYDCTDAKFKMKDVRIFEFEGEIRIISDFFSTVNLKEHDMGCYTFKSGEFKLVFKLYKGKPAAELTCGETKFLLAVYAKIFIDKLLRYTESGIFLPAERKKAGSSAYYELAYCKSKAATIKTPSDIKGLPYIKDIPHIKELPTEKYAEADLTRFNKDSLVFHMDDDVRFSKHYLPYFKKPDSKEGAAEFRFDGVNYYTPEQTAEILAAIEKDAPSYSGGIIAWLKNAEAHNGIFLWGI